MTGGQVAALLALGAFHGLNPAMGWLFAVARAMQERRRAALFGALPAIAAGHLASVAIVAALVAGGRSAGASTVVAVVGGVALVAFGCWRLLSDRHFRWAGMRLSAVHLVGWSFLVSSAHGAGLMLLPVLVRTPVEGGHGDHLAAAGGDTLARGAAGTGEAVAGGALTGLAAAGLHTVAMLAAAVAIALLVYEVVGVGVLRRAWFNVDRLWAVVLIVAGALTVAAAF